MAKHDRPLTATGTLVDRVIVGAPAWQILGAEAWGQFSHHADLGTGLVAYPIEGVGATLLMIGAALSNHFDRDGQRGIAAPLILATAFSVVGLLLTLKAAPIMLSLGAPLTAAALQRAMDQFFLWGLYLRGGADTVAFIGAVWALSSLRASDSSTQTQNGRQAIPR